MSAEAPLHPGNALTAALFIQPTHDGLESLVTHDTGCTVVMIQQKQNCLMFKLQASKSRKGLWPALKHF